MLKPNYCLTVLALIISGSAAAADPDPSELFDPAVISRGLCGASGAHRSVLGTFLQIAQSAPAPAPARARARAASTSPPLFNNLGDYSFTTSTSKPEAQRYFDQGLRLAYGFNHAEAVRAFRVAQGIDPSCAMCFWGEAWALGPNINLLMPDQDIAPALAAVRRASELSGGTKLHEKALITALGVRYSDAPGADRKALDTAYAEATWKAHLSVPKDPDVAVVAIEAAMNTTSWLYWSDDGREPVAAMAKAHPALEAVLAAHPLHPGAIHYYIHVMEDSLWPEKAEVHADKLAALMPGAGHMVHMPSHTYFQIGRYKDSLAANVAAVAVDEAYFKIAEPSPIYRNGYYPHNIHFALESAAMARDSRAAMIHAGKLAAAIPPEAFRAVVQSQAIGLAPLFANLRFAAPATVLALPNPGDDVLFTKGAWYYARGVASVQAGDVAGAERELTALADLRRTADLSVLEKNAIPAVGVLVIAESVLKGRIAGGRGDWAAAAAAYDAAARKQDVLAYMEPPYWYYPTRQSLGLALLRAGKAQDAVDALRHSLIDAPNNGWALYVLADAASKAGDAAGAAEYRKLFDKAWAGAAPPDLERL